MRHLVKDALQSSSLLCRRRVNGSVHDEAREMFVRMRFPLVAVCLIQAGLAAAQVSPPEAKSDVVPGAEWQVVKPDRLDSPAQLPLTVTSFELVWRTWIT
jgi:hypothetical protein